MVGKTWEAINGQRGGWGVRGQQGSPVGAGVRTLQEMVHEPENKYDVLILKVMIQLCNNFAHAMAAQLSWHVQICDLIGSLESSLQLW